MTYPKVSVIVPFYNSEEYLEQCLKSILDQTLFSFELILIDDGSTDQSLNICIKYAQRDSRIQIYKQSHKGPGPARNLGIKLANGKYLSFLDSDDFFEPNMLEKLYHCAERTNAETIFYWYSKFDNFKQNNITIIPNRYLKRIPHNRPFNPLNHSDILFQLSGSEAWKYFFRTDLIHQYNLKFAQTTCGEDIAFTIPARALSKRIVFLDEVFVHYRVNTENQLTKCPISRQLKKSYKQAEKNLKDLGLWDVFKHSFQNRKRNGKIWLENNKKEEN